MLTIRLQRVGRTNDPSFRVILTDSKRAARTGGFVEILGNYDARKGTPALQVDRIKHWLSVGAKTSDTMHNLLLSEKIIEGKKRNVLPKKSPPKKEELKEAPKEEVKAEVKEEETPPQPSPLKKGGGEVEEEAKPEEPAEAPVETPEEAPVTAEEQDVARKKSTEETPA